MANTPSSSETSAASPIPVQVQQIIELLQQTWQPCPDLKMRVFGTARDALLVVWLDGLVQREQLEQWVLTPLATRTSTGSSHIVHLRDLQQTLPVAGGSWISTWPQLLLALAEGQTVICGEGSAQALTLNTANPFGRAIDRPENEPALLGPQEAFTENLTQNIALLRKRLRSPRLKLETLRIGRYAQSRCVLIYVQGVIKPSLVEETRARLQRIDIDMVSDINVIRELIADAPRSLFPTTEETERPDRLALSLLHGRLALMLEGSPTAMLLPAVFVNFLTAPDDYYSHFSITPFLRVMRHTMYWMSILLPSLYVALLTYNQDLVPTPLLVSVASQHRGIPLPTVAEALLMMLAFETLREAGTRLPKAVGQSVSIVGTLVIGDAAVRAGIVSPGMVIVVAATGVASFALPALGFVNNSRLLQFVFVLAAGLFGLVGMVAAGWILISHLVSLRSLGTPYMSPVAPLIPRDLRDVFMRAPWFAMRWRPRSLEPLDELRNTTPEPVPLRRPEPSQRGKKR
ncbi:MAG: spore germination protein [Alicyclobacillus sp.]|nr:spore germination protein [Alicyclobacillus sp.]